MTLLSQKMGLIQSFLSEIADGIAAAVEFFRFANSGAKLDDLTELPGHDFSSAIVLLGPEDSSAGLRRIALRNSVSNRLGSQLSNAHEEISGLASSVLNKWMLDSEARLFSSFKVDFDDGTILDTKISEVSINPDGSSRFTLDVLEPSAQGPGLPAAPQSPGQFVNFTYSGDGATLQELANLARRYGISVAEPAGESSSACSLECEVNDGSIACGIITGSC